MVSIRRRPNSFRVLLWVAFVCMSLPLILALVGSGMSVESFAERCAVSVDRAFHTSNDSRLLVDQTIALERRARQYLVLGDSQLLDAYRENRTSLMDTAERIRVKSDTRNHDIMVREFLEEEEAIWAKHLSIDAPQGGTADYLVRFQTLNQLANSILAESNRYARSESESVRERAAVVIRQLILQTGGVLLIIALLIAYFVQMLTRPIRQIHEAIQRLGAGEFTDAISVPGPRDIQLIGARLDWLRRRLGRFESRQAKLLALISHELKTPLAAMREGLSLLSDGVLGEVNPEQQEVVGILRHASDRLEGQVEDLLLFTVARAQDPLLPSESVNFSGVVEASVAHHGLTAGARGISIYVSTDPVTVRGDPEQLRMVVDNLLSNAIKFTPEGGRIRVTLATEPHAAVLEVQDTGPGVSDEDKERIFEPFYQGAAALNASTIGTGIGLSIVAEHVEAHGGTVEMDNAVTEGTLFRIRLPKERGGLRDA